MVRTFDCYATVRLCARSFFAVDWFVRDVCAEYFQQHPMTIGGPGIEVEIDFVRCPESGSVRFSEVANVLQLW